MSCVLDPPSEPSDVKVTDITKDSAKVSWVVPEDDGGSSVLGYNIEIKTPKGKWAKVNDEPTKGTSFNLTKLATNESYNVRISAVNVAGPGDYAELTKPFVAKEPYGKRIHLQNNTTSIDSMTLPRNLVITQNGRAWKIQW